MRGGKGPVAVVALLSAITLTLAQNYKYGFEVALPEQVNMNSYTLEKIRGRVQKLFDNSSIPGGALLIARGGKLIFEHTLGFRDIRAQRPFTTDTICR